MEPERPPSKGIHGPGTNLFKGLRRYLTQIEQSLQSSIQGKLRISLLVALVLGAVLSFLLAYVVQTALGLSGVVLAVVVAPLTEEPLKALSILIVALFMWKTIPSRRYGALLGAAAGCGFSIAENILYSIQFASLSGQQLTTGQIVPPGLMAELIAARWFALPFMHVLWSAIVGVGIFVLIAQLKNRTSSPGWLALPFLFMGVLAHISWNGLSLLLGIDPFVAILVDILVIFIPFAFLFRDFLGGHFNFWNFLAPVQETVPASPMAGPPPPMPSPPPPPPQF